MVKSSVTFSLGPLELPWRLCVLPCIWKAMYRNITRSYFVGSQNWSMDFRSMLGSLSAASGIFLHRFPSKFCSTWIYSGRTKLTKQVSPVKQFSFKFISVWTHYLPHTDLPDFCWIEVRACSWVTIALKETNIVSQNHHKKKVKLKKTAFVDVSLPLKSGHLHCGKDNMEKVGPTKAKEPPPWTIGSLKDKRNRKYLQDSVEKLAPRNETERKITQ